MIKAYKIFTGADGHTHVVEGAVLDNHLTNAQSIRFKETPAGSSYDWHTAPDIQYVISLSGTLSFEMHSGNTFTLRPGEVLIAMDTTGTGHRWQLTDKEPWRRAYVTFDENQEINFIADQ
jgi:quercetin dioxygenase-like cupin family protein